MSVDAELAGVLGRSWQASSRRVACLYIPPWNEYQVDVNAPAEYLTEARLGRSGTSDRQHQCSSLSTFRAEVWRAKLS